MADALVIVYHFLAARHRMRRLDTPERLRAHQEKSLGEFRKKVLARSPFYSAIKDQPLDRFPVMDKSSYIQAFDRINTAGVRFQDALDTALKAERERDFAPTLEGLTVGLSSGTSGRRGVFMASKRERLRWAGVMLAKALPGSILRRHRIAFFLRANSNLYTTLARGRHISFEFYDLTVGLRDHVSRLNAAAPDVLTAPASILRALAEEAVAGRLDIRPNRVFSVAEVLEPEDAGFVAGAFGTYPHQIYQCTEGFLGISGPDGRIRLNEDYVFVEKEWIDREAGRFVPIITDFTRSTQPIVRYRLDDVLVEDLDDASPFTVLKAIEGRCDDVLRFKTEVGEVPIYGDAVRQAMVSSDVAYDDYRIEQRPDGSLSVRVSPFPDNLGRERARSALERLAARHGSRPPDIVFEDMTERDAMTKFRRISRKTA
jgi:putative adenylate-forming enzyme